ncbi:hypothetical protein PPTG_00654 [Phytophthora nicotianae INRA-310]|uniref:Mannosylglycerate hydrolase MGH1-like glycoside hydrolase domain-containing protein n=2 Tax=Phytophthora nicotianae (strain INRA-310) TaxID=761204 RepID=W2RHV1_PHYN3|nr:hypothetical protein PPTG_00654 [Phytophthora nicotianae INRA-310]ETN24244.1 hypothetical protein PPTG_00654 [Phytophthora nicotianae INRA-310]
MRLKHWLLTACTLALAAADAPCDERKLQRDAVMLLAAHVDVELGGIGAGKPDVVGFQYLKPAEAVLAAQALAHEDFNQAAAQFQRILEYQKPNGLLPHLVYGPSVPSHLRWIPSNRTFHPGPAFWQQTLSSEKQEELSASPFNTSTISAPPVAGDVAWEIFRLAPYDSVLGVRTTAVQFLCHVYEPLKMLQKHLFSSRRGPSPNSLLVARHPWETFSSLSPHWQAFLADLKDAPDYKTVVSSIPEEARARFAAGASTIFSAEDAVENLYEPMVYLAAQTHRRESNEIYNRNTAVLDSIVNAANSVEAEKFGVEDVEFNALMLRSSLSLVNIGRVLVEHSSSCTEFSLTQKELLKDMKELRSMARGLEGALIGDNSTRGLWNKSADFFADSSRLSVTSVHSLRGFLPGYAAELDEDKKMRSMKHFLSEPGSFSFFCTQFPASFFACSGVDATEIAGLREDRPAVTTWVLFNYYLQRGFARNKFPGLADYVRNKTRDMICEATAPARSSLPFALSAKAPAPTALTLAYDSRNAKPVQVFDDSYLGSTLAAAALLNILLPAVTPPPSPDTPPIDHRLLSIIMCVELVVAFGVAMSCFLFSVYFVANRPRDRRLSPASVARRRSSLGKKSRDKLDRRREELEDRGRSSGSSWADRYSESSYSDYSPRSGHAPYELEESLISEGDEHYGSFDEAEQPETPSNSAWKAAKKVLADISPW